MASVFNFSAIAVVGLILGFILLFAWNLGSGVLKSSRRSLLIVRRLTLLVAIALFGAGLLGLLRNLTEPSVTMSVPMENIWPLPLPGVTIQPGSAVISDAGASFVPLTMTGVSFDARLLWALGELLGVLLPATIALLVFVALRELAEEKPFTPLLARLTLIAGFVALVAGIAAPILRGIGGSMASYQALYISAAEYTGYPDDWSPFDQLPQPTVNVPLEPWPIGVAVALFALAAILRFGQQLQRETEGLV